MYRKIIRILIVTILLLTLTPIKDVGVNDLIGIELVCSEIVITCYNPVIGQTDSNPDITASGKRINLNDPINHRWVAISRDLEKRFKFGDEVYICGTGLYDGIWVVQDRMNKRFNNRVDLLVGNKDIIDRWDNVSVYKIFR